MESYEFHEYRMYYNGILHAIGATMFSIYCIWFTCPEGKTFFNDLECRETVRNSQVWTTMFTASYLAVETVFLGLY